MDALTNSLTAAILASGAYDPLPSKEELSRFSHLFAVDGGLIACHQLSLTPHLFIGDFDSCPKNLLTLYPHVEKKLYPKDKDYSDLELALQIALERGFRKAVAFGALGKRLDHSIYNLQLLLKFPLLTSLKNGYEEVFLIQRETVLSCIPGQTLSLFSLFEPAEGVSTKGCKWELQNVCLNHLFMSLSNEANSHKVHIQCQKGPLFCCLQNPLKKVSSSLYNIDKAQ